jgi:hypothetical protein
MYPDMVGLTCLMQCKLLNDRMTNILSSWRKTGEGKTCCIGGDQVIIRDRKTHWGARPSVVEKYEYWVFMRERRK